MGQSESKKEMVKVVGVALREAGTQGFFRQRNVALKAGDICIVEGERGKDYGRVISVEKFIDSDDNDVRNVVRVANENDLKTIAENKKEAKISEKKSEEIVSKHQKDMKLVFTEYAFDRSKMILYFTADGRVDFRDLVKDLANIFKTRIELRQIGVRDAAGIIGGLGACGLKLCCSTFLKDFAAINIKMAKTQNISLNPSKISGLCGRLLCCLKYEYGTYKDLGKKCPKMGSKVQCSSGCGTVCDVDILKQSVKINLDKEDKIIEASVEEVKPARAGDRPKDKNKDGKQPEKAKDNKDPRGGRDNRKNNNRNRNKNKNKNNNRNQNKNQNPSNNNRNKGKENKE